MKSIFYSTHKTFTFVISVWALRRDAYFPDISPGAENTHKSKKKNKDGFISLCFITFNIRLNTALYRMIIRKAACT